MTEARAVDVLAVGETMTSVRCAGLLRLGGAAQLSIAGAESNVAIGLARLGHHAAWSGRLGADESGDLILRVLAAERVDTRTVVRDPDAATGLMLYEQRLPGLARVEYHRAGSAGSRLQASDATRALDLGPRILHLTGITAALSAVAREAAIHLVAEARARGVLISFDVNYRSRLWSPALAAPVLGDIAAAADIVIGSPDELDLLGISPASLLEGNASEVVIKQGRAGATALTRTEQASVPAFDVREVDAIGAGDAFCAGYLSALLDGHGLRERLLRGAATGAFAVASLGDWEGLPARPELDLLAGGQARVIR